MAIAFVGAWTSAQYNGTSGGTLSGRTSTAGNFVAITVTSNEVNAQMTISHSQSGSVQDSGLADEANGGDNIWTKYIENIAGGSGHTITITTTAAKFSVLNAAEYSGVATSSSLDQAAVGTGNSTSLLSAATGTTAVAAELLIGNGTMSGGDNTTFTAGTDYTIRGQIGNASIGTTGFIEDRIVSSTGTYTASASWGGSAGNWVCTIVTFKGAAGGGDGTATPGAIAVSTSIPQATPIVPVVVTEAATANSATSTATLAFDSGGFAAGDMAVVVVACDNAGTSGANSLTSVTDAGGNTYTARQQATYDPGAASAGQTVGIFTAPIVTPLGATDDITVNFSPNTTSKAVAVWRVRPSAGYAVQYATGNVTAGSATGTPTVTTSSLTAGQLLFAGLAAESNATVTADSDTTNGTWSAQQTATGNTGTSGTSSRVASQWKHITGTGTQTYNLSITSCDNILAWIALNIVQTDGTGTPGAIAVSTSIPQATATGQISATATPGAIAVTVALPTPSTVAFPYPASISGRKVLDQFGDVMLMKTMAAWGMAVQLTDAEITTELTKLAALGFNAVTVWVSGRNATDWNEYTTAEHGDLFTGTPWQSSLGAGWAAMDWIVSEAARLGMFVNMSFGYGSGGNVAGAEWASATTTQMYNTGVAIATRYASSPNIVWHVMFDAAVSTVDSIGDRVEALFEGINDTEGASTRPVRWCEPDQSATTFSQGWLNFGESQFSTNTLYRYQDDSAVEFDAVWNESGATTVPVMDCEPPYVGAPHYTGNEGQQLRERTWAVFLRGGWGINFGHEDYWSFGGADLYSAGLTWDQVLDDSAEVTDQSYAFTVIDAYVADSTWAPNDSFVTTGTGTGDTKAAVGASDTAAIAYFPNSRTIEVDTTILSGTTNVRLRWYDPSAGSFTTIAASEAQQTGRSVTHPGNNADGQGDWVLVVDIAGDATATPAAIAVGASLGAVTTQAGAAPTPAAIAAPISVPQATPLAGSVPTPGAIAAPIAIPQATPQAGSAPIPDAIAVPITLPAATASGGTSDSADPDAIAVAITVPAVTTQAGSAATPAAIPVPVTLPQATPQAGTVVSPDAIPVPITLPAVTASGASGDTAQPAAIDVPIALPGATPLAGSTVAPVVINVVATLPQVNASGSQTATPDAVPVPITIPQAAPQAGSTASPDAIMIPIALPAATTEAGATVTPDAIAVTVALPQASASGAAEGTASPGAITVTTAIPQAVPLAGSTVTPDAIDAIITLPQASASGATAGTASPDVISVSTTIPAATLEAGSTATPAAITVPVIIGQATPQAGAVVAPDPIDVVVTLGTPVTGSAGAATPGAISVTVSMPAPTLNTDGTATPAAIAVLISVLAVTIISGVILDSIEVDVRFASLELDVEGPSLTLTVE